MFLKGKMENRGLLTEGKFKSLNTKKVEMHMSHFGVGQYLFNDMVQEKDESVYEGNTNSK